MQRPKQAGIQPLKKAPCCVQILSCSAAKSSPPRPLARQQRSLLLCADSCFRCGKLGRCLRHLNRARSDKGKVERRRRTTERERPTLLEINPKYTSSRRLPIRSIYGSFNAPPPLVRYYKLEEQRLLLQREFRELEGQAKDAEKETHAHSRQSAIGPDGMVIPARARKKRRLDEELEGLLEVMEVLLCCTCCCVW